MAPHPIPQNHPLPNPEVQDRFKRRLQTPGQLAPTPRARKIQILSWALSIGLSGYIVLFADFGSERNCYTPIREWFKQKKNSFWSLSEQEKKDLKEQGKL
ncbi:hypothetical protein A0J61_08145 [Choanephora cucurbitarum]|uniref:Uncharacterized protein n=1 Tax=Choanephora cucurbitarum TaxID=101091 RepID=A0A1C7N458_9FUNG|nr:hypothetical protein A0J61_08145 [Choanephora cucurbitarum]